MIKLETHNKLTFPLYLNADDPDNNVTPTEKLYYVLNKDGLSIVTNNEYYTQERKIAGVGGSLVKANDKAYQLKTEKIDNDTFRWLLAFFREVYNKYASEVNVLLYYSASNKAWYCRVPEQTVSAASVSYKLTDTDSWYHRGGHIDKAPEDAHLFGTIHSHAAMSAFFSGTDDTDDKANEGVQIVVGKVATASPEVKCRIALNGTFTDVNLEAVVNYDCGFPGISIPTNITKSTYTTAQGNKTGAKETKGYTSGGGAAGYTTGYDYGDESGWYTNGGNYGSAKYQYGAKNNNTVTEKKKTYKIGDPRANKITFESEDGASLETTCVLTSIYFN